VSALQTVKLWLVQHMHLAKDALHIYVALILFFGSALLFGWRLRSWRPWLIVAAAAVIGELWDISDRHAGHIPQNYGANLHDVWNTLFWPSVILLLARRTKLFGGR
jgi:hypothetical protein